MAATATAASTSKGSAGAGGGGAGLVRVGAEKDLATIYEEIQGDPGNSGSAK